MPKSNTNGTLGRLGRWLSPGMHLKRWLALAAIGAFFFLDGFGRAHIGDYRGQRARTARLL